MFTRRFISILLMLFAVTTAAPGAEQTRRLTIPLPQGTIDTGDLLDEAFIAAGLDPADAPNVHLSIDPGSTLGRLQLRSLETLTGGMVRAKVRGDTLVLKLDTDLPAETARRAKRSFNRWLNKQTRRGRDTHTPPYGISFVTDDSNSAIFSDLENPPPTRIVILVHGLDDPGVMWGDFIPVLREHGYLVARFVYPNDAAIAASADFFAAELAQLRSAGVRRVNLIGHSMGGLVCRDVLTRTEYYNRDGRATATLPAVDRLMMIGTPNHGSELARLRILSETRDQLTQAVRGDGHWLGFLADGSGQAGRDLLPGSAFLKQLNARPLATHTKHTIIAGRISPVDGEDIDGLVNSVSEFVESESPGWVRQCLVDQTCPASRELSRAVNTVGDGCVPLDSARLAGVDDFVIVNANHLSLITELGDDPPVAAPIVLERLRGE